MNEVIETLVKNWLELVVIIMLLCIVVAIISQLANSIKKKKDPVKMLYLLWYMGISCPPLGIFEKDILLGIYEDKATAEVALDFVQKERPNKKFEITMTSYTRKL